MGVLQRADYLELDCMKALGAPREHAYWHLMRYLDQYLIYILRRPTDSHREQSEILAEIDENIWPCSPV